MTAAGPRTHSLGLPGCLQLVAASRGKQKKMGSGVGSASSNWSSVLASSKGHRSFSEGAPMTGTQK